MKNYLSIFLIIFLSINCADPTDKTKKLATDVPDGTIIASSPFKPATYEQLEEYTHQYMHEIGGKQAYSRVYDWYQKMDDKQVLSIDYASDGLLVKGFLIKPKDDALGDEKWPVIIYNRGGHKAILYPHIKYCYELCKNGYVVLASQYRGCDGGQGNDEFGGADVHDVLNIIKTAKRLPYTDINNIFMYGGSRGGLMTYLAIKAGAQINAATVRAAPTNFFSAAQERPKMEEHIFKKLIPGKTKQERDKQYKERSALFWIDKLNVPLLIMHGDNDWRVDVSHAQRLQDALIAWNKKAKEKDSGLKPKQYCCIIYGDDGHGLNKSKDNVLDNMLDWFKKYTKKKKAMEE